MVTGQFLLVLSISMLTTFVSPLAPPPLPMTQAARSPLRPHTKVVASRSSQQPDSSCTRAAAVAPGAKSRRSWLSSAAAATSAAATATGNAAAAPATDADVAAADAYSPQGFLGNNDAAAQATGNVREGADLDAALGITWGGRDRCDAANPLCGPDGQLRKEAASAAPVPQLPAELKVTDEVEVDIQIGRTAVGTMRIGLFGEASPENVRNILLLCESRYRSKPSDYGTGGTNDTIASHDPVFDHHHRQSIARRRPHLTALPSTLTGWTWGTATYVENGRSVSLGVAREDQGPALARRRNLRKAPEDFQPAERPPRNDDPVGEFDGSAAGFVSVPFGGLNNDLEIMISTRSAAAAGAPPQGDRSLWPTNVLGEPTKVVSVRAKQDGSICM